LRISGKLKFWKGTLKKDKGEYFDPVIPMPPEMRSISGGKAKYMFDLELE
jgi:hypothetical protein